MVALGIIGLFMVLVGLTGFIYPTNIPKKVDTAIIALGTALMAIAWL